MNPQQTLQATLWTTVAIQTIGSVDLPGRGERKLPAPRQYVAIVVLWSILGLAADVSDSLARAAASLSILAVLTSLVVGPAGQRLISFLNGVSALFPTAPQASNTLLNNASGGAQSGTTEVV